MIRFRLKELIADLEFREGRVVSIQEIAQATGIHRATLSKIANERGYNTGTENVDRLCQFFKCRVDQLLEVVPDEQPKR